MLKMLMSKRIALIAAAILLAGTATTHAQQVDRRYLPSSQPPACDSSCQLSRQAQQDAARARADANRGTVRDDRHDGRLRVGPNTSVGGNVGGGGGEINVRRTYR